VIKKQIQYLEKKKPSKQENVPAGIFVLNKPEKHYGHSLVEHNNMYCRNLNIMSLEPFLNGLFRK
jgi:hypothetical protein